MFCVMGLMNNTGYYLLYFTVATAAPSTVLYSTVLYSIPYPVQYSTRYSTVIAMWDEIYTVNAFFSTSHSSKTKMRRAPT